MKLLSALDSLLHQSYSQSRKFPVAADVDGGITGRRFYESVILRAVESPEFRARLLKEPGAVLSEAGILLPEGVKVTFVENAHDVIHIVIPPYVGE